MVRVLLVDDDVALCSLLAEVLRTEGYDVESVTTGAAALASIRYRTPDLVLLDVELPDVSGLYVCRQIRRLTTYVAVIMLTGHVTSEDELRGFDEQADDYVTKPFAPKRLLARMRNVLRLTSASRGRTTVSLGAVEVDLRMREVRRDGRPIRLGQKEFDLFAYLIEHPGQVFGKMQLLRQVWGPDFDGDTHTVETRISRLRAAIEPNPNRPVYLHTRRGVGYFLTLDAKRED